VAHRRRCLAGVRQPVEWDSGIRPERTLHAILKGWPLSEESCATVQLVDPRGRTRSSWYRRWATPNLAVGVVGIESGWSF
jgi:hypothetical protein